MQYMLLFSYHIDRPKHSLLVHTGTGDIKGERTFQ